ncbi:hypothetical protein [Paenibacillus sp. Leaf72]|uniref:hypothetical protein n=1 Tax=Paenibacillus sp. Leaf72 TaxID=1736234 RepID=UPI0006FB4E37|nr:hypothetical protein [Paenibacillus sp. Leaf72]KQO00740.1 hypothetical protein ASF12_18500 [Paenibacillus sp. Leaf72]
MDVWFERWKNKIVSNVYFKIFIVITSSIGVILMLSEGYQLISKAFEPSKEALVNNLLGVNKNYQLFSDALGSSDYKEIITYHEAEINKESKISIYHHDLDKSIVSLITDENNIVIGYTIVLKNKNNKIKLPPIMREISGLSYLNDTTSINNYMPQPYDINLFLTLQDTVYTELHGTGSYADYNYYLLGFSQVGYIPKIESL